MAFRKLGTILADLMSEPDKLQAAATNAPRMNEGGPPHHAGDSEPPAPGSTALRRNDTGSVARNVNDEKAGKPFGGESLPASTGQRQRENTELSYSPRMRTALPIGRSKVTASAAPEKRFPPTSAVIFDLVMERERRHARSSSRTEALDFRPFFR